MDVSGVGVLGYSPDPGNGGAVKVTVGGRTPGITRFLGGAAPTVGGRFAVAPDTVDPFIASTDLDRTRFDVAAEVDVFASSLIVRAEVFGSFSDNYESYGGGLKVEMPF